MILVYFLTLLALSIFSYSQVDAGMGVPLQLARFMSENRLIAGISITTILVLLFVCYFYFIKHINALTRNSLTKLIAITLFFSFIAYPAVFSHDVYNYLMYGKILVLHHHSPYFVLPSNYPSDPLFQFLHWPNTPSRYGPVWDLAMGVIVLLEQKSLFSQLFLFKVVNLLSYTFSLFFVAKIAKKLNLDIKKTLVVYAFNPLIIIDCLVNPHIDGLMTLFVLFAMYRFIDRSKWSGIVMFVTSVNIKITSFVLVPIFFQQSFWPTDKKGFIKRLVIVSYLGSAATCIFLSIASWYFILPLTVSVFLLEKKWVRFLFFSLSGATLVRYLPYFYLGYFDPSNKIRFILFGLMMIIFLLFINKVEKIVLNKKTIR